MNKHVELIDPAELRVHSLAAGLPERSKEDPEFLLLVEDVRARGIQQPLICVKPDLILDGRERWKAARRLQLEAVPVIWNEGTEPAGVIVSSLRRKHLSKGALAYVLYPFLAHAFEESRRRRLENLRKGQQIPESTLSVLSGTVEEFAGQLGISRILFFQAKEVREAFAKDKGTYEFQDHPEPMTLREYYEPKLLCYGEEKPLGLGGILAGIAGLRATGGKARPEPKQLVLFEDAFETLRVRFSYWQRFEPAEKSRAREVIEETVAAMPEDLVEALERAIKARRKK